MALLRYLLLLCNFEEKGEEHAPRSSRGLDGGVESMQVAAYHLYVRGLGGCPNFWTVPGSGRALQGGGRSFMGSPQPTASSCRVCTMMPTLGTYGFMLVG